MRRHSTIEVRSVPQQAQLGARQRRFVDEYLIDCNATRAAITAGYTKRTASQAGWEVLRNPKVAAEISRRQKLLAERHAVSADNVISELAKLGFSNLADFYSVDEKGRVVIDTAALADPVKAAALSQIEVVDAPDGSQSIKLKLVDKGKALGDLSKHLGLLTERHEVSLTTAAETPREDTRRLALAALALLSEVAYQPKDEPLLIEQAQTSEDDDFDFG
jgi:phage terminase small subunit